MIVEHCTTSSQSPKIVELLQHTWQLVLVQNWIGPELNRSERHGAIESHKVVDTLGPLHHVRGVR